MPKTQVTLTDEKALSFIAEQIEGGEFDNPDDVVTDAICRMAMYQEKKSEWDAMIAKGQAQADRGELVDGESYMQEMQERLESKSQ